MSARAISSGSLSFGLVNVPVKLYATTNASARVSFHWLHEACGSRVRTQYYCPKDDKAVGHDELVRGYEISKGHYVPVHEEELASVKAASRDSIDILEFVPTDTVDVLYLDHSYYLAPDKRGAKAYAVLVEAMRRSGRIAVARYAARGKEHVVTVRVDGEVLVMHQLRFADEVRAPDELPVEHESVSQRELALALQLIEQTSADAFEPSAHTDEVRARTKQLLARKRAAGEVAVEEPEAATRAGAGGKVIDLMEALKASLAGGKTSRPAPTRRKPAATPRRKPARAAGPRRGRRKAARG